MKEYTRDYLMPFKRMGLKWGLALYLSPPLGLMLIYSTIFEGRHPDGWTIGRFMCILGGMALAMIGIWYVNRVTKIYQDQDGDAS